MPAKSEKQRRAAGAALAAKRGKMSRKKVGGSAKSMMGMSQKKLREFAKKPKSKRKSK